MAAEGRRRDSVWQRKDNGETVNGSGRTAERSEWLRNDGGRTVRGGVSHRGSISVLGTPLLLTVQPVARWSVAVPGKKAE